MAPSRTARVSGPSTQVVSPPCSRYLPTRSAVVRSSWQATVISGRPSSWAMVSTNRVLPHPVGPFNMTARFWSMRHGRPLPRLPPVVERREILGHAVLHSSCRRLAARFGPGQLWFAGAPPYRGPTGTTDRTVAREFVLRRYDGVGGGPEDLPEGGRIGAGSDAETQAADPSVAGPPTAPGGHPPRHRRSRSRGRRQTHRRGRPATGFLSRPPAPRCLPRGGSPPPVG